MASCNNAFACTICRYSRTYIGGDKLGSYSPRPPLAQMDTSQWIDPAGASFHLLPPWAPISPNAHNVVVSWSGYLSNSQPPAQDFIPDTIGQQWHFDAQNLFDQSVGVVNTFPSTSYMNYDGDRDTIASVIPTFHIRRSLDRLVPQRRYANNRGSRSVRNFTPEAPILFDTYSGPGFPMKDALHRNFKALIGREDPMLPYGTAISLRFEFEGYEPWTCQVKTRDSRKVPKPIPREKLAHEVAKKLAVFLEKKQVSLDGLNQDTTLDSVNVRDLVLVRLDHASKASWQPQFMIVRDV